jgi:hypothetical protein
VISLGDLIMLSLGNLRRMKLRASLTVAGVVIAIGAFVAMLSFGAGNRRVVDEQFETFGLLSTMHVYPPRAGDEDARPATVLDDAAVERFATLPGVQLAHPFDTFEVTAALADTQVTTTAQPLSAAAARTPLFSQLIAGSLDGEAAWADGAALVTREFLELAGIEEPEAIVGERLVVAARMASLDSALTHVFRGQAARLQQRIVDVHVDSLADQIYQRRVVDMVQEELNAALARFVDGYMTARAVVTDTLVVRGVLRDGGGRRLRAKPILIPMETARRFSAGGLSADPTDLFAAMRTGHLFPPPGAGGGPLASDGGGVPRSYPQVTLVFDPRADQQAAKDSIEALGYRTFSYATQYDEIRKAFLFFDLALAAVGCVALVTASLGIANTMMMSITERRREIGVLASLGADAAGIRGLFLVESAVIGAVGSVGGILLGWLVARLGSTVAKLIMERQGVEPIELFTTPLWLVGLAFAFGVAVSLAAGAYPAARAARVDPVEALRHD